MFNVHNIMQPVIRVRLHVLPIRWMASECFYGQFSAKVLSSGHYVVINLVGLDQLCTMSSHPSSLCGAST